MKRTMSWVLAILFFATLSGPAQAATELQESTDQIPYTGYDPESETEPQWPILESGPVQDSEPAPTEPAPSEPAAPAGEEGSPGAPEYDVSISNPNPAPPDLPATPVPDGAPVVEPQPEDPFGDFIGFLPAPEDENPAPELLPPPDLVLPPDWAPDDGEDPFDGFIGFLPAPEPEPELLPEPTPVPNEDDLFEPIPVAGPPPAVVSETGMQNRLEALDAAAKSYVSLIQGLPARCETHVAEANDLGQHIVSLEGTDVTFEQIQAIRNTLDALYADVSALRGERNAAMEALLAANQSFTGAQQTLAPADRDRWDEPYLGTGVVAALAADTDAIDALSESIVNAHNALDRLIASLPGGAPTPSVVV